MAETKQNLANIKMLIVDVDGVLTDSSLIINADGSESKIFNTLDGHGIRMWQRAGLKTAFLSGRMSEATEICPLGQTAFTAASAVRSLAPLA